MIRLKYFIKILFTLISLPIMMGISLYAQTVVNPTLTLNTPGIADQDDMCIWIHHSNKSLSTIITSDKAANKLFVYDLSGNVLQTIDVPGKPGNIDIRYNFMISGVPTDIVGYNDRTNGTIVFYKVDRTTRQLSFVSNFSDGGMTGNNYGFCLYRSLMTDKYYAIASSQSTQMKQWELVDNGDGTIGGLLKRTWNNGSGDKTEGLVADDELGILYAANEGEGIYKYNAEPNDPNPIGVLIAPTGVNGLTADVEGITIYYSSQGNGYLMASSQGSDNFKVYERQAPHNFVKTVQVTGVGNTDGIDVTNLSLGTSFPLGLFLVHDGTGSPYVIRGSKWEDLGLEINTTYWDPTNIPNSPTNLAATVVSQTQIDLSWTDNSSNEDGFRIERKLGPGGVYTEIATVGANVTTYQDTGRTANTEYCSRVRAYNTGGNSGYSNEDCAITNPTVPTSPGNLTAEATGVDEVTLNWTDNSNNEDGYIIERENVTLLVFAVIDSVGANVTSYIDSTVSQGVSYNYRISAFNISGQSGYSNVSYVTTILPAPTNLVGQLFGGPPFSVVLNWQESSINELGFVIERDTAGLGSFETLDSVAANVTFYEDTNFVIPVDTFCYRIYAFSQDTVSDYSNIAEIIIPVELISFTANVFENSVTLSWTTATELNNFGFEIQRKQDNSVWEKIGFAEGHGTTTEIQNYQYIDNVSDIQATSLSYRLKQLDYDGSYEYSEVVEVTNLAPTDFALHQNYPNPFNPVTTISYSLPVKSQVKIVIYNTLGESVTQLINGEKEAGRYKVKFSATGGATTLPSGIYFYRLQSGSFVDTKKMILLK
ncbi:MAG: phytase [Bacteroidetes bacterium]|nr:phytase [Bacteroidota bacterium]